MNDQKTIITGLILALVLGLGLWYFSQNTDLANQASIAENPDQANQNNTEPTNSAEPTDTSATVDYSNQASVDINNYSDPYLGDPNAPVTILEYFSYGCGHCYTFHNSTFKQLKSDYIDTGKVKIMSRQLFGIDQLAQASLCAAEQGKFWEYHNTLFTKRSDFASEQDLEKLKTIAADLGLDSVKFNDCYDNSRYATVLQEWVQDGQAAGITGVPTFFVNGEIIQGNQPYSKFVEEIEKALKN
jgi:protein-disulfide isomerase